MAEPKSARIFISYSHDSSEHADRVLGLANQLQGDGHEVRLDQYVNGSPVGGWPKWMHEGIDWADFVLVVCTESYHRRFRGKEEPNRGLGATWEGTIITSELYHAAAKSTKFVPVIFHESNAPHIPSPLNTHTHYYPLVANGRTGYEGLYAFLTGISLVEQTPIGPLRKVASRRVADPSSENKSSSTSTGGPLHGVPALPPHFLPRPAPLGANEP